jgi:cyclase
MKIRIIPTILTDGVTVVKGEKFDNWRTVGSAEAIAKLFASRNVDELLFLDVNARKQERVIDPSLIQVFSDILDIPFGVGGGINTYEDAENCFRNGAEKVVLGTSAIETPKLVTEIADGFGAQAVIASLDLNGISSENLWTHSGKIDSGIKLSALVPKLEKMGVGEILLQNVDKDGLMNGMDLERIRLVASLTNLPIIASSGCGGALDAAMALYEGASSVAAGAIFQFTQITPRAIKESLMQKGFLVRNE